jgi:hypothetical protein
MIDIFRSYCQIISTLYTYTHVPLGFAGLCWRRGRCSAREKELGDEARSWQVNNLGIIPFANFDVIGEAEGLK